jgi:alanine dehydrogenase
MGFPREVKNNEYRVAHTPSGVTAFVDVGHRVLVESMSGIESCFTDEQYKSLWSFTCE